MELLSHANFDSGKSISDFEDEPEVMMLDFSDKNIYEEMVNRSRRGERSLKRGHLVVQISRIEAQIVTMVVERET